MQPECSLPDLFAKTLQNYLRIKKEEILSSSEGYKVLIEQSCALCDEIMRKTNELSLFSKNETLDDLSSASIRYLTIPAFLAYYTSQKFEQDERLTSLKLAQTYYDDFLDSVESYGFPNLPKRAPLSTSGDGPASKGQLQPAKIDPEKQRNEKIRAYRERKNLEDRLEKFLSLNSPSTDEEVLREESIALIRYWAFIAVEDLRLIKSEVDILKNFQGQQGLSQPPSSTPSKPTFPTQCPLLITKEKIQATVFGAGYPSVPTMTLDQFVDLQIKQGMMPALQPVKNNSSSNSFSNSWRRIDPSTSDEAKQAAESKAFKEDYLEDSYSEEQRAKVRRFDEFKDDHRRGSGNRTNRG